MLPTAPLRRARLHAVKRRLETLPVTLEDPLPQKVADGVDVLLLVGYTDDDADLPALQAHLEGYRGQGPVVLGVPQRPGHDLPLTAYHWLYRGLPLEVRTGRTRPFLTALARRLYHDAPGPWHADHATRQRALDFLLDFETPLWLPLQPGRAQRSRSVSALLGQALVEPGLLRAVERQGNSARYELAQGDAQRPEGRLFTELLQRLYQHAQRPTLAELLHWLAQPPRGLRGTAAWIYLVAALRCHSQDVSLTQGNDSFPLTREQLQEAMRLPSHWRVDYRPAEPHEQALASSVTRLFDEDRDDPSEDLWRRAQAALERWWHELPSWTRQHHDAHSPNALNLARLCERSPDLTPRELLQAASRSDTIPRTEDQSYLLDRLEAARLELEGHLQGQYDRMATRVYALFQGRGADPFTSRQWLDTGCREWLAGVPPRTADAAEFNPWTLGLRNAILSQAPPEQRWFEELPRSLELPPLSRWDADHTVVFLARLARARLELELWTVLRTLPLAPRSQERQQQVADWIRQTLQSVGLTAPRAEKILFELLEQLYAREA